MSSDLISIVLPVHNQADHVGMIVREYEESLARLPDPHELLLVENGSTDATYPPRVLTTMRSPVKRSRSWTSMFLPVRSRARVRSTGTRRVSSP